MYVVLITHVLRRIREVHGSETQISFLYYWEHTYPMRFSGWYYSASILLQSFVTASNHLPVDN